MWASTNSPTPMSTCTCCLLLWAIRPPVSLPLEPDYGHMNTISMPEHIQGDSCIQVLPISLFVLGDRHGTGVGGPQMIHVGATMHHHCCCYTQNKSTTSDLLTPIYKDKLGNQSILSIDSTPKINLRKNKLHIISYFFPDTRRTPTMLQPSCET